MGFGASQEELAWYVARWVAVGGGLSAVRWLGNDFAVIYTFRPAFFNQVVVI